MKVRRISRLFLPLLFLLALPAGAQASWTAPVLVSDPGQGANGSQVGVDQAGNAVFVWTRSDGSGPCHAFGCYRIQTRARSAVGSLSAVQTLSGAGKDADRAQVAVDQNGNAFFVWERPDATTDCGGSGCYRIQMRVRSATGTLSSVQTLSGAGESAFYPQVAVDQNDDAVVVWSRFDGSTSCGSGSGCLRIQTRTRSADGTLSAIQTLSSPGQSGIYPQVGADQSGDAVFVWLRGSFAGCLSSSCTVQARARSAAGTLSAVQNLSPVGGAVANEVRVGVDQSGDALFTWLGNDATTDCHNHSCIRAQAVARSADGTLSTTQTLSTAGEAAFFPRVAVDQVGNAVFAWSRYDGSTGCRQPDGCLLAQTVFRSSAGALSAVQTLSPAGQGAFIPEIGIDQNDNAVYAWQAGSGGRIKARTRSVSGTLGTVQIVSGTGLTETYPDLAVNASGNAVASWNTFDSSTDCGGYSCQRIAAAVGP